MLNYNISRTTYDKIINLLDTGSNLEIIAKEISENLVINREDAFNLVFLCGLRQYGGLSNKLIILE